MVDNLARSLVSVGQELKKKHDDSIIVYPGRYVECAFPETHGNVNHCCCMTQKLIKVAQSNGCLQYAWWCVTCGRTVSTWIRHDLIDPKILDQIEPRDDSVSKKWWDAVRLQDRQVWEENRVKSFESSRRQVYEKYMQSDAWKVLRNRRLQADGYICQDCGGSAITAHHIFYPDNLEDTPLWCLVSLCRKCHAKAHRAFPPSSAPWSTKRNYEGANEEDL